MTVSALGSPFDLARAWHASHARAAFDGRLRDTAGATTPPVALRPPLPSLPAPNGGKRTGARVSGIETKVEGIGHMLADRYLAIPDYQRSYSWTDDEVRDLWRDLNDAVVSNAPEYFLGSVVTTQTRGDNRYQVIDGQQRLASVSLICAAMRDILNARADERGKEIEKQILGERDILTRVIEPRLTLNAEDNHLFRQLTLVAASDRKLEPTQESHNRLISAFEHFYEQLTQLSVDPDPDRWALPLLERYLYLQQRAQVINVDVGDEARAFVIFETLNDRGLNLSTTDLLKNHLLGVAGSRIDEAKHRWTLAMSNVGGYPNLDADLFLRQYWASKMGVVRIKALFSQIKPTIATPDDAVSFASDLAEAAPCWAAMYDRDADLWAGYSEGSKGALETLRSLNVVQCRPLLLAAIRVFSQAEMTNLLANVIGWSIRWFVVGGGSGGVVEKLYASAAKDVSDGHVTTSEQVRSMFEGKVPDDVTFSRAFENLTVRRGWLARYYLAALERAAIGDPQPELVPNQDVEEVNLEHVLPRNAKVKDWPAFSSDERQSMLLLLGNQALLRKDSNALIGNKPFAIKRPVLAASAISLTRCIGEEADWTPHEISSRGERLAALAPKVWPA